MAVVAAGVRAVTNGLQQEMTGLHDGEHSITAAAKGTGSGDRQTAKEQLDVNGTHAQETTTETETDLDNRPSLQARRIGRRHPRDEDGDIHHTGERTTVKTNMTSGPCWRREHR